MVAYFFPPRRYPLSSHVRPEDSTRPSPRLETALVLCRDVVVSPS
jgi:hypothetical protein